MSPRFEHFKSTANGTAARVRVRARRGVTTEQADALIAALDDVPFSRLEHAHGSAADVPALLYAATVGDAATRKAAWWELWGNVHHQGTVYSASVEAVPFLADLAESAEYPDRVQALAFLRAVALGDGGAAAEVALRVRPYVARLLEGFIQEPEQIRRAVAWVASAYPALVREHPEVESVVPKAMRATWAEVLDRVAHGRGGSEAHDDDATLDREDQLEAWLLAGSTDAIGDDG